MVYVHSMIGVVQGFTLRVITRGQCWPSGIIGVSVFAEMHLWPILLTWFNFNPGMDK